MKERYSSTFCRGEGAQGGGVLAASNVGARSSHPGSIRARAGVRAVLLHRQSWALHGFGRSERAFQLRWSWEFGISWCGSALLSFPSLFSTSDVTQLWWRAAVDLFAWCRMFWLAPASCHPLGFVGSPSFSWRTTWRCPRQGLLKGSADGGWRRDKPERQSEEGLSVEMFALRLFFCCEGGE